MPVELPVNVFSTETIREVEQAAPWVVALMTGLGISLPPVGVLTGIWGLYKVYRWWTSPKKKPEAECPRDAPFPRALDEARQLREQARIVEGRIPEYDAAVGRIAEEELILHQQNAPPEEAEILQHFWLRVRDRADRLLPPSTLEYRS